MSIKGASSIKQQPPVKNANINGQQKPGGPGAVAGKAAAAAADAAGGGDSGGEKMVLVPESALAKLGGSGDTSPAGLGGGAGLVA